MGIQKVEEQQAGFCFYLYVLNALHVQDCMCHTGHDYQARNQQQQKTCTKQKTVALKQKTPFLSKTIHLLLESR